MALNESITPADYPRLACPSAITSGMPVLIGNLAAVAQTAYDSRDGKASFMLVGAHILTVIGQSTQSPVSGLAVKPGDELFANGTLDVTTNITYNLTIDKTRGSMPFGNYIGTGIASGATDTAAVVRLKVSGYGPPQ